MHTEKREEPLVELGYEIRDLNTVAIRNAAIGFFIFAIGSAAVGFVCYRFMNPAVFEAAPAAHRIVPQPPFPLLQSNLSAKTDIMSLRQHETEVLTAPIGWADPAKTHLHIPIEKAMEIIATKGLPAGGAQVPAISKGHTPDAASTAKPASGGTPQLGVVPNPSKGATSAPAKPAPATTNKLTPPPVPAKKNP